MIELARSRAYFEVSDKLLELCNKLARKTTLHQQTQRLSRISNFNVSQYKAIHLIIHANNLSYIFFNEENMVFYLKERLKIENLFTLRYF